MGDGRNGTMTPRQAIEAVESWGLPESRGLGAPTRLTIDRAISLIARTATRGGGAPTPELGRDGSIALTWRTSELRTARTNLRGDGSLYAYRTGEGDAMDLAALPAIERDEPGDLADVADMMADACPADAGWEAEVFVVVRRLRGSGHGVEGIGAF